ncbi:class F sortase [Candidatus Saccharibacteria bacterium]|nr:class F sortase [Candidatus Saccharibacteria bacterium]
MIGGKIKQVNDGRSGLKMRRFVGVMRIIGIAAGSLVIIAIATIMVNEARMKKEHEGRVPPLSIPSEDGAGIALPANVTTGDEEAPSWEQVTSYRVAPNKPRFIRVSDLGVFARVIEVGIRNGAVDAPNNIFDVGWFIHSALPGGEGAALMVGHGGGGNYPDVVFDRLGHLNLGSRIEIEMGDGRKFTYVVAEKNIMSIDEANDYMGEMMKVANGGTKGLNLISCTGTWLTRENTLDRRVMIRAVLEE